ncbi:MAG TPA: ABC transporter substrate-binding protein [Polyangiaceae bacterium]|nr:ABC transporter substrate-binding protein [Polyangiaceae bacterium]
MTRNLLLAIASFVPALLLSGCEKDKPAEKAAEPAAAASAAAAAAPAAMPSAAPSAAAPTAGSALKIAYSDWPGWVAWDIAMQKGWFKEEGVDVELKWFEYAPSMEAYSAGKVDAVAVTNGDALVTGSSGSPSVGILINDYSNGNDMIVAKKGITSVAQLKGKTIGVEVGFVDHLLLLNALASAKLTEKDVKIKNVKTDETPQALKSGEVDAVAAWQPNSGAALREVPGSTAIFTSSNVPGLIYDVLAVNPKSLTEHRADWMKVVKVWMKIADFVKDEKNLDEAAKIMSARVGLTPDAYKKLMSGTAFQDLAGNVAHFKKADGLDSIYGSSKIVDDFNVKNTVYKTPMKYEEYLDPSFVTELSSKK